MTIPGPTQGETASNSKDQENQQAVPSIPETLRRWLLAGDVAIQYQVRRDLFFESEKKLAGLRARIATEGWGSRFLAGQHLDGHWGRGFYQPKWTSSHYTLLDIKNLGIRPEHPACLRAVEVILQEARGKDGGVNPTRSIKPSDVCVNGMFLNYACYFQTPQPRLVPIVDFLISQHMPDGGFNCWSNRGGATHSSLHSTLSVLEGLHEYARNGYTYELARLETISAAATAFVLQHSLFRSDKTQQTIDRRMLLLSYPSRWRYDILRALDYLRASGATYDDRMRPALDVLKDKRRKDLTWPLQARHPGLSHFEMERVGVPSRWNTLRALRVLAFYDDL